MQGLLSDLPLLGALELIHTTRQTGVLDVQTDVPYAVAFVGGEIVSGGIVDWIGLDALYACPLLAESGSFSFERKPVTGRPLGTFNHIVSDWARTSDEWQEVCAVIGSPSRYYRGAEPLFDLEGGRSVRGAARAAEVPVFQVAQFVVRALRDGRLEARDRFEWFRLKLQPAPRRAGQTPEPMLPLGQLIERGMPLREARARLLNELRLGLRFTGSGWVWRDLVWEVQQDTVATAPR
ncbi:hypothetical protein HNQ07_001028 [Deinococcus metalli]|uniref:PatA-like N-terminal domain-containing protein n=1 Tax=Deinococcus metalli TaxID=1141878 RepID=A0A7W8KFI1_9DEIO|nr:DUF4388 domain-containing protein [Deinococcus metalli]MBB5375584.1 hypothetical protein [Deinococcus metalli]GHF28176.1 hypothetical protein GCM10017781_00110 [Deinococcus metalli]